MEKRLWLIEKRGKLTQSQVAILSGISRTAYSNIENGRGLSVAVAKKIASALKFDWKIFFDQKRFDMNQNKTA
ncbi:helix-turn-helix transcriptional regulator [Paenibacillus naphthalenovorans]|uniref:helix-turn-helix transcriptional regulator n=1 Tax=Paenibacillus naphthalenovorans TaxID=162209 RepID=UPI000886EE00|nr:helix-turn-helix transcriptional regulator [Paenibacillus naphthalenovorans]SDJ62245.1 DNA-binding transcriptional regulator, XRE-family HTH domain [Paenibacillus naphthalenovorans]